MTRAQRKFLYRGAIVTEGWPEQMLAAHVEGCDVERCARCSRQRISCGCEDDDEDDV